MNSQDAIYLPLKFLSPQSPPESDSPYETDAEGTTALLPQTQTPRSYKYLSYPLHRNESTGKLARIGVYISMVLSMLCISGGVYIATTRQNIDNSRSNTQFPSVIVVIPMQPRSEALTARVELMTFALFFLVTMCTEPIGFVHAMTLRSALAAESRLDFNTNVRILTAARGWANPNGTFANAAMALLLAVAYASSNVILSPVVYGSDSDSPVAWLTFALPLIIFGSALLLKASIALAAVHRTHVVTWSSSALSITELLLHDGHLVRAPDRCMCNVLDRKSEFGPRVPVGRQPSAWRAHASVRKIVVVLWWLTAGYAAWGASLWIISTKLAITSGKDSLVFWGRPSDSWAFYPGAGRGGLFFAVISGPGQALPWFIWPLILSMYVGLQGALTLGLHCAELVVGVVRDEMVWRAATSNSGTQPSTNPFAPVLFNSPNLVLMLAKTIFHWMFGLTFSMVIGKSTTPSNSPLRIIPEMGMLYVQTLYLAAGLFVFAFATMLLATYEPRGPQPAAYGHLQTLANLIDEWSAVMWWGHKEGGIPVCHAGTSNSPLPSVKKRRLYAGR